MRSVSTSFYKSKAWKNCRVGYIRQHPYCEECMKHGRYTPAQHIHHKVHLSADNIDNPAIALAWENLEALCQECHNTKHFKNNFDRRYVVGKNGEIIIDRPPI